MTLTVLAEDREKKKITLFFSQIQTRILSLAFWDFIPLELQTLYDLRT